MREIKTYMRRVFVSGVVPMSVILYLLLLYITIYVDFQYSNTEITPIYYFLKLAYISSTQGFILIITSLPVASLFCKDWRDGIFPFVLIRTQVSRYTTVIFISNILVVTIITFISEFSLVCLLHTKYAFYVENSELTENFIQTSIGGELIFKKKIIEYYFFHAFTKAIANNVFSAITLFVSIHIPNPMFFVVFPYLLYTVLSNILPQFGLTPLLNPAVVFSERNYLYFLSPLAERELFSILYPVVCFIIVVSTFWFFTYLSIKNKLKNEGELS